MLSGLCKLTSATVTATDGALGHVTSAFFDDQEWAIRYLVVEAGTWLSGCKVLLSPQSIKGSAGGAGNIDVTLTREQVENSPGVDTHQPVSRRHELVNFGPAPARAVAGGGAPRGMEHFPLLAPLRPAAAERCGAEAAMRQTRIRAGDIHLRDSTRVTGYRIRATDEGIGHVDDFLFDDRTWTIRYLVVDTRNWWPGGRRVLVATRWIERIEWATQAVHVGLTRARIRNSPEYVAADPVRHAYQERAHAAHGRHGYPA